MKNSHTSSKYPLQNMAKVTPAGSRRPPIRMVPAPAMFAGYAFVLPAPQFILDWSRPRGTVFVIR